MARDLFECERDRLKKEITSAFDRSGTRKSYRMRLPLRTMI